jgi:hypothetical protein
MVDTKPLLKGFGAAVDVAGQIATDKAVNSRRVRPNTFDVTRGTILVTPLTNGTAEYKHDLGRVPVGAMTMISPEASEFRILSTSVQSITIWASGAIADVTLWVV